jgi:predicted nucleic acid-binding protein
MTVTEPACFDTNILIYSIDNRDQSKHLVAKRVIEACYAANSLVMLQTLNEFYRAVTRKHLLDPLDAASIVEATRTAMQVIPPTDADLLIAMQMHQQDNIQFFDAFLIATARRVGCRTLLSEDLQNGRTLNGLKLINPFLLSPEELDKILS